MKTKILILLIAILIVGFVGIFAIYKMTKEAGILKKPPEERRGKILIPTAEECYKYWYECKAFCAKQENLKICQSFCEENLNLCGLLPKEDLKMPSPVLRPNLTLSYYKGLGVAIQNLPPYYDFNELAKKAKELKTNIISIFQETKPEFRVKDLKLREELKIKEAILINAAHENGLFIQYMLPCYFEENKSREEALSEYLKCVGEYAEFATERDVYHLTLHPELEVLVPGEDDLEKYAFMEKVSKEGLKEIRKYYTGKVGIGFCCLREEYFNYNFSGYDYYLGMFYAGEENYRNFEDFSEKAEVDISSWVKKVPKKIGDSYQIKTLILGETGVCNPNRRDPDGRSECFYMRTVPCNPEEEASYYEIIFKNTYHLLNGYFLPYETAVMSIKDEPAEKVVKEWYSKLSQ